ncbi:Domain of unknown function (DUF4251) [Orpheovirus IHUMI-LCC2]|uniref:Uncharacterized protein n=1 Tax=Orpheovirus IHUMI-LCC2 TaxID=2023057 RepID=A0A2I2L4Z8_9VIRU|nr:Domain of unknown function (DUF4251) [Orpheovirus IHUMI-LCC2]SNW62618.1 Domain of unknown function (DUF4251) [Orpheovirus IHUMI-LCC2]
MYVVTFYDCSSEEGRLHAAFYTHTKKKVIKGISMCKLDLCYPLLSVGIHIFNPMTNRILNSEYFDTSIWDDKIKIHIPEIKTQGVQYSGPLYIGLYYNKETKMETYTLNIKRKKDHYMTKPNEIKYLRNDDTPITNFVYTINHKEGDMYKVWSFEIQHWLSSDSDSDFDISSD